MRFVTPGEGERPALAIDNEPEVLIGVLRALRAAGSSSMKAEFAPTYARIIETVESATEWPVLLEGDEARLVLGAVASAAHHPLEDAIAVSAKPLFETLHNQQASRNAPQQ